MIISIGLNLLSLGDVSVGSKVGGGKKGQRVRD
jgi:hypothetical protein